VGPDALEEGLQLADAEPAADVRRLSVSAADRARVAPAAARFPQGEAVYDPAQRWHATGVFAAVMYAACASPGEVKGRAVVAELWAEMQAEVGGAVSAALVD